MLEKFTIIMIGVICGLAALAVIMSVAIESGPACPGEDRSDIGRCNGVHD